MEVWGQIVRDWACDWSLGILVGNQGEVRRETGGDLSANIDPIIFTEPTSPS